MNPAVFLKSNKGIDFVRMLTALGVTKGNMMAAADYAQARYGYGSTASRVLKAAIVSGGLHPSADWGQELETFRGAAVEFFSAVAGRSIIGGLNARRVPLRTKLVSVASGSSSAWVGQGSGKVVTKMEFSDDTLEGLKAASIVVISKELLESTHPAAEAFVREEMLRSLSALLDLSFVDPGNAGTADVEPASITNGVSAISGSDDAQADLLALAGSFDGDLSTAILIMSPFGGVAAHDASSLDLGARGGSWRGIPVVTSSNMPADLIVLADSERVAIGEGDVNVDVATAAALQMDSAPTVSSTVPTSVNLVSLWQTNSVAWRVERTINWLAMPGAVALVDGATWSVPQGQT